RRDVYHGIRDLRAHCPPLPSLAPPDHPGFCGLVSQSVEGVEEVEVGYMLDKAYWGRGLATEAARASRDYGFERLGLRRLISLINPENAASLRVAEKNGMRYERDAEFNGRR